MSRGVRSFRLLFLAVTVASLVSPLVALAQSNPGSTVNFGQQLVGTVGQEVLVAQVPNLPESTNTISFNVTGDFRKGPSTTCPTIPSFVPQGGCIFTVVFAPTQTGTRRGQLVDHFGLCPFGCPDQTWN